MNARLAVGGTLAAFAAVSVLFSGAFPPFANPNELSRQEAVVAARDHGTFAIDSVIPVLGDHEDKSLSGGKTYSNKAPGLAFAALPVYALLRIVLPSPSSAAAPIFWILRVLTVTLVCAVALARLARRLAAGPQPETAPLVVAAVAFGTPYLFFARSFFAHAWTAALLFLAWDALRASEDAPRGPGRRGAFLAAAAGFLAGWAAISEYPVAPVAGLLALRAVLGEPTRRFPRFLAFVAGAAVPLAKLAYYDAVCFGSPWVLSSAREAYPSYSQLSGSGLFGFGVPSPRVAVDYLFHPARGLLLFSPFLIWAVPGFVRWWTRAGDDDSDRTSRADCLFAAAATVVTFVLMCGYPNWHGGWSLGNRYLVPILFFPALAIPDALASARSRGFFGAAVVLSAATHLLLTASWPYFPDNVPWPAATGSRWFLARGWTAPSLLDALPGGGWAALLLAWAAAAVAIVLALRVAEPPSPGPAPVRVIALLGLVPLLALALSAPELDFGGRLWRASIFGAYSGRDPERGELRGVAMSATTPREQRMAAGAWRVYGPNPNPQQRPGSPPPP
ncbi:MAG TPA: hypothetical protein VGK26_08620 [Thermoanaerobaculia bacterium]